MSPILKRDVAEQVRQARRLAAAAGIADYEDYEYELDSVGNSRPRSSIETKSEFSFNAASDRNTQSAFASSSARRPTSFDSQRAPLPPDSVQRPSLASERNSVDSASSVDTQLTTMSAKEGKSQDLKGLLFSSTPSLLLGLIGLVFSGESLEHCARWRVFRRVDELFILVPMIGNSKGNSEMCLSARLGTSASSGELDQRRTRRGSSLANSTSLGSQALSISCLAAILSFSLGLFTTHRLGDVPSNGFPTNGTVSDPSQSDPWREGRTSPGFAQLVMVLATGMASAGFSSLALGSFMCSLVVSCRWKGLDPDNITPPLAACLGDSVTIFISASFGTALVGTMDTPVPSISVLLMSAAAVWFTIRVSRVEWVRNVARGGWSPSIGAMLISSGTGMVLAKGVGHYKGFASLAISMTGLTGSIGAIHANRLSTTSHANLSNSKHHGSSPKQSMGVSFLLSFPVQGCFSAFVNAAGWTDVNLAWAGWLSYIATTIFSSLLAHGLTLFCWARDMDPDSYTLPIHSAIVDFVGQLFLMGAYESCRATGRTSVMAD